MSKQHVPVITVDGLSGTGKGTLSRLLAKRINWHYLDSGLLYRSLAWAVTEYGLSLDHQAELLERLKQVDIEVPLDSADDADHVRCDGKDISQLIRQQDISKIASKIAAIPQVRQILIKHQRAFRQPPGLVADGRDMGTVIFPDATVKFFLMASDAERAKRRFNQLNERGISVSLRAVQEELHKRDDRDEHRSVAPTRPAPDAIILETTDLSIEEVLSTVVTHVKLYV